MTNEEPEPSDELDKQYHESSDVLAQAMWDDKCKVFHRIFKMDNGSLEGQRFAFTATLVPINDDEILGT